MKLSVMLHPACTICMVILLAVTGLSCSDPETDGNIVPTDYSISSNWLSRPETEKPVDVFYLYPTSWHRVDSLEPAVCTIDHQMMRTGAASVYERQATAFETCGNVYAPFYRQADAKYTLRLPESQRNEIIRGEPLADATAAFDYFIENFNQGRPFILAGHSQGSTVLIFMLEGYVKKHPRVFDRMIAAYLIGYPVTQDFLDENRRLKFAEGPDDTGVIISFNTQAPDVMPGANPVLSGNIGLVINPISWTRNETRASTEESLGSYLPVPGGSGYQKVMNYADARIDTAKGVLICSTVDEDALYPLTAFFGRGIYHSFDFPFYFFNIRQNAENRVEKYFGKGK